MNGTKRELLEILVLANDILEGKVTLIEGSRKIDGIVTFLDEFRDDSDFQIFKVVDSETDHLPVGSVRKEWSREALVKKDKDIEEVETFYRGKVLSACHSIISRFSKSG